ncbi:MAG: transketolase [Pseudomonadota bacterium]|nr:transketolase [Pseudomonadota bacterium]
MKENKKEERRNEVSLNDMANAIRFLAADAVENANSGHPGMPMGASDFTTVLYSKFLKIDPKKPDWPDRDRLILSAGHGSMLLYAVNHLIGYEDMTIEQLKNFRQLGSITPGHPEYGNTLGVETTTGPLGQGISTAVGMAIAEKVLNNRFGDELVNHNTYVIASDGDLMEGISHEAISLAGHLCLNKLIVLFDDNNISIDGSVDLSDSTDQLKRFEASGWSAERINGHNFKEIEKAIKMALVSNLPSLIACKTTIGLGAPTKSGQSSTHGSPLGKEEIAEMRKSLNWNYEPFEIPPEIKDAWRLVGLKNTSTRKDWENRLNKIDEKKGIKFKNTIKGNIPVGLNNVIMDLKKRFANEEPNWATRKSSQEVLEAINPIIETTIGGSADLTGSNNTKTKDLGVLSKDNFQGRFIHYGIREHAMAAAMNGMALHKGILPYSGTFLVFSDYCRPAIRLASLMKLKVIHVMTHDSIGLGEDGPTHQPVEHLPSLRAIPNLKVFRPADATETAECWQLAIENSGPSIIALSRQGCIHVRNTYEENNKSSFGGYELSPSTEDAKVNIIATGSEISIALEVKEELEKEKISARVISMPCFEIFDQQEKEYKELVLGKNGIRVGIEASMGMGWNKYLGDKGIFIGMNSFGASAPSNDLFNHFEINKESVIKRIKSYL